MLWPQHVSATDHFAEGADVNAFVDVVEVFGSVIESTIIRKKTYTLLMRRLMMTFISILNFKYAAYPRLNHPFSMVSTIYVKGPSSIPSSQSFVQFSTWSQ